MAHDLTSSPSPMPSAPRFARWWAFHCARRPPPGLGPSSLAPRPHPRLYVAIQLKSAAETGLRRNSSNCRNAVDRDSSASSIGERSEATTASSCSRRCRRHGTRRGTPRLRAPSPARTLTGFLLTSTPGPESAALVACPLRHHRVAGANRRSPSRARGRSSSAQRIVGKPMALCCCTGTPRTIPTHAPGTWRTGPRGRIPWRRWGGGFVTVGRRQPRDVVASASPRGRCANSRACLAGLEAPCTFIAWLADPG